MGILDDDIQEGLERIGELIQDLGRIVSEPDRDLDMLITVSGCLASHTEAIDSYIRTQHMRWSRG